MSGEVRIRVDSARTEMPCGVTRKERVGNGVGWPNPQAATGRADPGIEELPVRTVNSVRFRADAISVDTGMASENLERA